jgi:hypothetical protein
VWLLEVDFINERHGSRSVAVKPPAEAAAVEFISTAHHHPGACQVPSSYTVVSIKYLFIAATNLVFQFAICAYYYVLRASAILQQQRLIVCHLLKSGL